MPVTTIDPTTALVLSPRRSAHLTQERTVALESRLREPRHLLTQHAADTVTDGAGLIASSAGAEELAPIAGGRRGVELGFGLLVPLVQRLVFGEPGLGVDALGVGDRHELGHRLMCGVGLV
ncbi:hypothetical protein [Nonomuraea sp. NPDC049684]|uniref:hypothetical protein n=1 Tax=Nonomuraea sp. NPDC049684 TaxID=3364356 RepID=UPI0037AFD497